MWTRYAALGDSFTEGLMDVTGPDGRYVGWADRVAASLARVSPSLEYVNLAVRGKLIGQVVEEQVPIACDLRPDLVTLAAGVNDALRRTYDVHASATHMENAVRQLRGIGTEVVLFAFGDPSRRSSVMGSVSGRIATANSATHAIAERYGCRVVDFWGCAVFDDDSFWDEDRLHLSPAGHALAARAALATLEACPPHGAEGVEADLEFHRSIARATENPQFERLLGFLEQYQRDAMRVTRTNEAMDSEYMVQVREEHRAIAAAVMRGDVPAAREAAMRHMSNAAHRIEHAAPPIRRALDALLAQPQDKDNT